MPLDRDTFLTLHEADLRAAGEILAAAYHEEFSRAIDAGMVDALAEFIHDDADHNLLIPSLKHHIHESLSRINKDAASGWATVFFTNLNESYNEGNEP